MRRLVFLSALLSVSALARPPRATKKAPTARTRKPIVVSTFGEVASVAGGAAYLNRGSADGVTAGQSLTFQRAGKPAGSCIVGAVSEHFARCDGGGLRPGDRFASGRVQEPTVLGPAALPTEAELRRRQAMVEGVGWRLRDFDVATSSLSATRFDVALSHTTYFGGGAFGVQRLDILVPDFEIWRGLRVSADVTALNFSARPSGTRTIYQQTPVLLVRQLEVGFRRADVPFSAALGRTWLRSGAGLLAIDGAQAAWRFSEGVEVGAWGGLLPEAARLTIQPSQWSVGAFGRVRASLGGTLMQLSVRGGYSQRDLLGGRAELGVLASLWSGATFDATLAAELGFGQSQALAGIDAARFDFGWRPVERLRLGGGVRYRGLPLTSLTEVGTTSPGQRALHADLGGTLQLTESLWLGAVSGFASDFDSGLWQLRVGPELSLPRLASLPLTLGVGYVEEVGWLRGRHGYAQVQVTPGQIFRLTTRLNFFQQAGANPNPGLASQEVGTSVAIELTPWRFLRARVALVGRLPVGVTPTSPIGSVQAQVGGGW
ncbi:MAG: hypothetical protein QM817_01080 [Archangium sp.]